jgi:hypothetical protein
MTDDNDEFSFRLGEETHDEIRDRKDDDQTAPEWIIGAIRQRLKHDD